MTRRPPLPVLSHTVVVVVAVVLGAAAVQAQPSSGADRCRPALTRAEASYQTEDYEAAIRDLDPCLTLPADQIPAPAYRLLILAHLRQQQLGEAQGVAVRLLASHPGYSPDAILDPPLYVAFVTLVQRQISLPERPARERVPLARLPAAVDALPPAPALRLRSVQGAPLDTRPPPQGARGIVLSVALQGESYDGERRRVNAPLAGLVANAGPGVAVGIGVPVSRHITIDGRGDAFRLPALLRDGLSDAETGYLTEPGGTLGFPVPTYPTLVAPTTSRWVASAALSVRVDSRPGSVVSPYVRAGGRVLARRLDGQTRWSLSPEGALGADLRLARRVVLFAEVSTTLVVADGALDAAVYRRNGDLLTGLRSGLRLRLDR